ncbi:hypothetical protein HYT02_02295 [Candidatus Gottesmanbacteria bacterium]|nr:hypothetical protein [Candidatus Gottesmanbacteria bacterium]
MKKFSILFIVLLILPFVFLYFKSGYFYMTHDGLYHLERTFYYVDSIKEGNLIPSWSRYYNSGFGSPIFIFLFPIPYLITSLLYIIGFSLTTTVKLAFVFFLGIGIISLYLLLNKGFLLKQTASLFGCLLFIFSPLTISQVFVRGSLRELAGMAVFSFVLLATVQLSKTISKRKIGILALVSSIYFLTDGLTVILFALILGSFLLYFLIKSKNRLKLLLSYLLAYSLGIMTSSYMLLPFLKESKYLKLNVGYFYRDHFIYPQQYFDPHWGFGFSMPGPIDGMSFQIGIINILVIAIFILLVIKKRIKLDLFFILLIINLVVIFSLVTYSPLSLYIWEKVTPLRNIQLAWRLLTPVVLILALIGAYVANYFKISKKAVIAIYLFTLLVSFKYLRTNQIVVYEQRNLIKNSNDATAFHEFIPIYRERLTFAESQNKVEFTTNEVTISNFSEKNNSISFSTNSEKDSILRVNTLYFPGWEASVDGIKTGIIITESQTRKNPNNHDLSGLIEIQIPQGNHDVNLQFKDTQVRKQGKVLSILGFIISIILII